MRRSRGQALVEMALVLPLLLVLLAGVLEFGWTYYQLYHLNNATRLAARVGAGQAVGDNDAIVTAVDRSRGPVTLSATPTVAVSTPALEAVATTNRTVGNYLTVYVRTNYSSLTGLVDLRQLGGITQLRSSCTFVIKP